GGAARAAERGRHHHRRWRLQKLVGGAGGGEVFQPVAGGVGVQAEGAGGSPGPLGDPVAFVEELWDVVGFNRFPGGWGVWGRVPDSERRGCRGQGPAWGR